MNLAAERTLPTWTEDQGRKQRGCGCGGYEIPGFSELSTREEATCFMGSLLVSNTIIAI